MNLIERVVEQIREDLYNGVEPLEELLSFVPRENLIAYLPEEEWSKYENEYCCDNCGGGFLANGRNVNNRIVDRNCGVGSRSPRT